MTGRDFPGEDIGALVATGDSAAARTGPPSEDLERALDRGPVGFVITDSVGVIEYANATLCDWLGLDAFDLIGARTFQSMLSPGGRIYFDTHVRPLVHMRHAAHEIALELVTADRRRLPVLINASLRTDERTGRTTMETFVVDATRRRRYESELLRERQHAERSEAQLQVMYDMASGLAEARTVEEIVRVVTDRAGRSITGARCSLWLLDRAEQSATRLGALPPEQRTTEIDVSSGGPALARLAAGELVVIEDCVASADTYPLLCAWMAEAGVHSAAIAPLTTDGRLSGAMAYGFTDHHSFDDAELQATTALAAQTEQALSRARTRDTERRNRLQLERLLEFTTMLSAAVTLDEVIGAIVDRGQELLGAVGSRLALLDPAGTTVRFVRSVDSSGDRALDLPLDRRSIGCEAIRTNRTVKVDSRDELARSFPDSPILDHPNLGRVMAMPLRRGDEVLGAWVIADTEAGASDAVDETMFGLFAEQAGQATQRAALYEAETLARSQAELRNQVSAALNGAATTSDVARAITLQGRAAFAASAIAVFVVDPEEPISLHLETQDGLDDDLAAAVPPIAVDERIVDLLSGPATPTFVVGPSRFDSILDVALGPGRRGAAALLPLSIASKPLGVIVMGFEHYDALPITTRAALSGLTAEANVALARARRYDLDHDVAVTLQRSLLPTVGEVGSPWSVTTFHEPWGERLEVGGDLFDVTPLADGRIMVVVGDVVGHGLVAAAAMGMLRSAAKMLALSATGPAEVIAGLQAFADVTPGVRYSTVCCVDVGADGSGRYSCAGHPYPILRHRGGRTEVLGGGRSPLLGVSDAAPSDATFAMEVGSSIVVYTDGLIEQRGATVDDGLDHLVAQVRDAPERPEGLSAIDLVASIFDGRAREDDVLAVCLTRLETESRVAADD